MPSETTMETCEVLELENGRWVPAIPEPYPLLLRVRCSCGAKFWSRDAYRLHYAAEHVRVMPDADGAL